MKIMFICSGNTCRSAMAHWMLKKKIEEMKINNIEVYSSGIYAETGDIPTEEAIETMEEYGIDLKNHKATNIYDSKIEEMDLILCLTNIHKLQILRAFPQLQGKLYTIKEYVEYDEEGQDQTNIKDPWGYGVGVYRICAAEIEKCLELLIKKLDKNENI